MRIDLSGVLAAALLLLANHHGQAQTPPSDLTLRITVVAPAAAAPATLDAPTPPALAQELSIFIALLSARCRLMRRISLPSQSTASP